MSNDQGDRRTKQAVKTTIVGGQPPGNDRSLPPIPVGIEDLIGMAAVNGEFATALYEDRAAAITAGGVELTATERGILAAIDDAMLAQMVANVERGVPNRERRWFLHRSAAALLVLAGGGAVASACSDPQSKPQPPKSPAPADAAAAPPDAQPVPKDGPPPPPPDAVRPEPMPTRGISPDRPKPDVKPTGINPDRPPQSRGISPDRPKYDRPTKGVRPDRPERLNIDGGVRPDLRDDVEKK